MNVWQALTSNGNLSAVHRVFSHRRMRRLETLKKWGQNIKNVWFNCNTKMKKRINQFGSSFSIHPTKITGACKSPIRTPMIVFGQNVFSFTLKLFEKSLKITQLNTQLKYITNIPGGTNFNWYCLIQYSGTVPVHSPRVCVCLCVFERQIGLSACWFNAQ